MCDMDEDHVGSRKGLIGKEAGARELRIPRQLVILASARVSAILIIILFPSVF